MRTSLCLHDWQRRAFIFVFCLGAVCVVERVLSPNLGHLKKAIINPPVWVAVLFGVTLVAYIDVTYSLDPNGYQASAADWLAYGAGPTALVSLYRIGGRHLGNTYTSSVMQCDLTLSTVADVDWQIIEFWLKSDGVARYDLLGHRDVAHRLAREVNSGTRAIGIVGPYGSGKTSVANWIIQLVRSTVPSNSTIVVSHHSCWGFETSSSSIHEMLADAIKALSAHVDTFSISSLPDSYRQSFSAGGAWIETLANLAIDKRDHLQQFKQLSDTLIALDIILLFIVEDLDRNDSRSFDVQEVLGFLQRLKGFANVSFILTGGLTSSRVIDFAKLCDRIEYMRPTNELNVSELIKRVYQRCCDRVDFACEPIGGADLGFQWNPQSAMLMRDLEEMSLPDAVSALLVTPRSLRHAPRANL